MSRRMRVFALVVVVASPLVLLVVLVVQAQMARTGPRLADEDGSRPRDLIVGGNRPGPPVVVVWLGDSTTTGVGVTDFADSMTHLSAAAASESIDRPVALTVIGVSGAQAHEVVGEQGAQFDEFVATTPVDVVVISVGANDVTHLTRRPTFRDRYGEILDLVAAGAPDAEVVMVGIPDMGSVPRFGQPLRYVAGRRAQQLDDDVRNVARDAGHRYVDLAAETGPRFRRDPDRFFSEDDFHPGVNGHQLWFEAVRGEIVTAVRDSLD